MSKTKGGGSTRNGRDSNAQRLGVKAFGGNIDGAAQTVANGTLFVNSGNSTATSPHRGDAVLAITVDGK